MKPSSLSIHGRQRSALRAVYEQFLFSMLIGSAASMTLLVIRYFATGTERFGFLAWNLFLAWIPALISLWFTQERSKSVPRFVSILMGVIWLVFLPNAFYVLSDFIHIRSLGEISILYDVVMLFLFSSVGFLLGVTCLGVMHLWLRRYLSSLVSTVVIFGIIFIIDFSLFISNRVI